MNFTIGLKNMNGIKIEKKLLLITTAIVHGAKTGNETLGFSWSFLSFAGQESSPKSAPQHVPTVMRHSSLKQETL